MSCFHLAAASEGSYRDATRNMAGCISLLSVSKNNIAPLPHSSRGICRVTLQGKGRMKDVLHLSRIKGAV